MHAAHTWCVPVLKGHQWCFWLMWQWEYLVTSPWSETPDAVRDGQRTSLPLKTTQRTSDLNNQLVEMSDPVIHTDSCVPKTHLMLQNCHNYFLQFHLKININQIHEQNYLHRFFFVQIPEASHLTGMCQGMTLVPHSRNTELHLQEVVLRNSLISCPVLQKAWNAQVLVA